MHWIKYWETYCTRLKDLFMLVIVFMYVKSIPKMYMSMHEKIWQCNIILRSISTVSLIVQGIILLNFTRYFSSAHIPVWCVTQMEKSWLHSPHSFFLIHSVTIHTFEQWDYISQALWPTHTSAAECWVIGLPLQTITKNRWLNAWLCHPVHMLRARLREQTEGQSDGSVQRKTQIVLAYVPHV